MKQIQDWINKCIKTLLEPVSTQWLGIFRISFFGYLLVMWYYHFEYRELLTGNFGKYTYSPDAINYLLMVWLVSLLGIIVGLFTRVFSIINYLCAVLICDLSKQNGIASYFDNMIITASLLAIFTPISHSLSIDKKLFKLNSTTTNITYITWIVCTLGLMYTASGISKLLSIAWLKGLGIWLPLSLPHSSWNKIPEYIVDFKLLLMSFNYIIILWEVLFLILIGWHKTRKIAIMIGMLLHLSIAILFYLPKTAIGMLTFYLLFGPYFSKNVLSNKLDISILSKKYIFIMSVITIMYSGVQGYISINYMRAKIKSGFSHTQNYRTKKNAGIKLSFYSISNSLLGINARNLFTDNSLYSTHNIIAISTVTPNSEYWLPWVNKKGEMSSDFKTKAGWSKIMQKQLWDEVKDNTNEALYIPSKKGIEHALRYWIQKNDIEDSLIYFNIYIRNYVVPQKYEHGLLFKQKEMPWQLLGHASYTNGNFFINIAHNQK
jgi:hypothetical protein